uniref:Zinc knuckle CX2CX4HX4C n=1 Tax=Tanacetum cinerariifolium TaxID=118510 RepID=A0A6L2P031_TANCI|nr:zinc knuckle CX2CX4HX4C [Tanacetum cinerariifolium]
MTTSYSAGNALGANLRKAVRVFTNPNVVIGEHSDTLKSASIGLPISTTGLGSSPTMSKSSPLVSLTTPIYMPRGPYNVDLAATFGVPLANVGDLHLLIKDLKDGKHYELLSGITNDDRMAIMDTLGAICNSIQIENNADVNPRKVSHIDDSRILNVDKSTMQGNDQPKGSDPIMQSVDINTKSYAGVAGVSAKEQPKVSSNFRILVANPVFDGVNIFIPRKVVEKVSTRLEHTLYGYFIGKRMAFLVVEYYARNNWAKHRLKRIMMNSKGFFFFKFDSRKWSMDTRLLKEELTRILIRVKLHDVPIRVFKEDGISLIATFIRKPIMLDSYTSSMCNESWGRSSFARCLIEVNSEADLVDVVTIGIPSLTEDDFTKETIRVEYEWRPPKCDTCKIFGHTNDGFQTVGKKKKKKGKSKSNNGGQSVGLSVKQNVRYEPKAPTSTPKKGAFNVGNETNSSSLLKNIGTSNQDNIISSNSFSTLNVKEDEEEEEHVENVYDETANLHPKTKTYGFLYHGCCVPSNLDNGDMALLQTLDFTIYDLYGIFNEV